MQKQVRPSTAAHNDRTMAETIPALQAVGYQVHQGTAADGDLAGRWWWTRFQPGWGECESSPGDFDSADQAWAAAATEQTVNPLPPIR